MNNDEHLQRAAQTEFLVKLLTLRRTAHLTQAELAAKIGMPQSSLARIESGKANPTLKTLLRIAAALRAELTLQQRP